MQYTRMKILMRNEMKIIVLICNIRVNDAIYNIEPCEIHSATFNVQMALIKHPTHIWPSFVWPHNQEYHTPPTNHPLRTSYTRITAVRWSILWIILDILAGKWHIGHIWFCTSHHGKSEQCFAINASVQILYVWSPSNMRPPQ